MRHYFAGLGILIVAILGSTNLVRAESGTSNPFCQNRLARDYAQPFKRMPSLIPPPSTKQLPFGPPGTFLYESSESILVPGNVGGVSVSYSIQFPPSSSLQLDWTVVARIVEISNLGRPIKILTNKKNDLSHVTEKPPQRIAGEFDVGSRPRFYRFETLFRKENGHFLARYGQYLRVVRPRFKARLAVGSNVFHPGDDVPFRVENMGTREIEYTQVFVLERYNGVDWERDPASPTAFFRNRLGPIPAGGVGICQSVSLPRNLVPSRYRITKRVRTDTNRGNGRETRLLIAEFEVQP